MIAVTDRAYQASALEAARDQFRSGKRRVLLVAPTGAGKTVMFCKMVRGHVERGGRVLIVVHRRELLEQAISRLGREGLERIGEILSGRPRDVEAAVQVASIGTLLAMHKRGEALPPATLVIFDEGHHFVAEQWGSIAANYSTAKIVGVTATPERADGTPLGDLFESIITVASVRELTDLGFLVPCEVLSSSPRRTLAQDPVDAYREHAGDRSGVVFLGSVAASKACAERFNAADIPAAHIDGMMPTAERADILERFARGELRVVCNVFVLTEGWDCGRVEVAILARGFSHVGPYLQAVGRVLRLSPETGKASALVLDLRGAARKHGLPDEDRTYSLEGRPIGRAPTRECPKCSEDIPLAATVCPFCSCDVSSRRLAAVEQPEALRKMSRETREADYWDEQVRTARERGYALGWAAHRFQEKFGRFPRKFWREAQAAA